MFLRSRATMASRVPPATATWPRRSRCLPCGHRTCAGRTAKAEGATHVVLDGKLFASDRLGEKTTSVKGEQIDAWYSGRTRSLAATFRPSWHPTDSRYGSPTWHSAPCTTWRARQADRSPVAVVGLDAAFP
jgi:hypothetical protein